MKRTIVIIVLASILYFLLGFMATLAGWLDKTVYLNLSAIIGSVASVSGLLAFGLPRGISNEELEQIESNYLQRTVEAANDLKEKERELSNKAQELSSTEKEIKELELKKQEMEFLVRKVSLSLFLQDQIRRSQDRILEIVQENQELRDLLGGLGPQVEKLQELEEEVSLDKNAELLADVIESSKAEQGSKLEPFVELRPSFFGMSVDLKRLAQTVVKNILN